MRNDHIFNYKRGKRFILILCTLVIEFNLNPLRRFLEPKMRSVLTDQTVNAKLLCCVQGHYNLGKITGETETRNLILLQTVIKYQRVKSCVPFGDSIVQLFYSIYTFVFVKPQTDRKIFHFWPFTGVMFSSYRQRVSFLP